MFRVRKDSPISIRTPMQDLRARQDPTTPGKATYGGFRFRVWGAGHTLCRSCYLALESESARLEHRCGFCSIL